MGKNDLRFAVLQPNNGSVVIYYSRNGIMRFPTGISISKKKNKDGKFADWDYKANRIKPVASNALDLNTKLTLQINKANNLLEEAFRDGSILTAGEFENLLKTEDHHVMIKRTSLLVSMYEQFWERKREYFQARDTSISLKDYTSLKHMLQDYEMIKGKNYRVKEVDNLFLHDLLNWMQMPQPTSIGNHKLKTKGMLNSKTLKKRFDVFLQFFKFLKGLKMVEDIEFIRDFMFKEIRVIPTQKVTLDIEEVHKLYEHRFSSHRLNKIKELFVFGCFTGIRWTDLVKFDSRFIRISPDGKGKIYKNEASKTRRSSGLLYQIPMCDVVLEILESNGNSLKPLLVSNDKANQYIKEAMQVTGKFDDITNIKDKKTGQYLKRYEAVTMHKGRDTFITNLIESVPLAELMKYTGHKKLSTLQKYYDASRPVKHSYITVFNQPKITKQCNQTL